MKKFNDTITAFFILVILGLSCSPAGQDKKLVQFYGQALGTAYSVSYYSNEGVAYQVEIDSLIAEFNSVFSIYDTASLISEVNNNLITEIDNNWFSEILYASEIIYKKTNGLFDPTVGSLVNAWGFGTHDRLKMNSDKIDSILDFTGFDKIKYNNGVLEKEDIRTKLDFNAIAKGYCVDLVGKLLEQKGINSYLIEIGGEIVAKGIKPDSTYWRIGIEKPADKALDKQEVFQIIKLHDRALATSGSYRRYFEEDGRRYSHTINPTTGYPVDNNLLSVTVVAETCLLADAYATAFMVMGVEETIAFAEKHSDIEVFLIYEDKHKDISIKYTDGFKAIME